MGKRIYWSTEELEIVTAGIRNLLEVDGVVPKKVALKDFITAANLAQKVLPIDRQRLISGFSAVEATAKKMGIEITNLGKSHGPYSKKKAQTVESPVPAVPAQEKTVTLTVSEVEAIVDRRVQEALNRMLHAWVDHVFPMPASVSAPIFVAETLAKASENSSPAPAPASTAETGQQQQQPRHCPFPKQDEKKRVKKMTVVGVLPSQANAVSDIFGDDIVSLKFWKTGSSINQLGLMVASADEVILMTDKISHSHTEKVLSIVDAAHTHRVKGGVNALISKVQELL